MRKNNKVYAVLLVVMICNGTPVFQKINHHGNGVSLRTLEFIKEDRNKDYGSDCVVDIKVMKTEKQADAYMVKYMKDWEAIG